MWAQKAGKITCLALAVLLGAFTLVVIAGAAGTIPKDVVVYYSFDRVEGESLVDESGKGHDGKINGTITFVEGKRGQAAKFEPGAFIDLGVNFPSQDIPTEEITICAWVKCASGTDHEIFNARGSDGTWIFHPEVRGEGNYRWLVRTSGMRTIFEIKAGKVEWDKWVHFAAVYSAKEKYGALYINGEEIDRKETAADPMMQDWGQGARIGLTVDYARPFTGLMDDFIIWNKALTPEEIRKIMADGPTP